MTHSNDSIDSIRILAVPSETPGGLDAVRSGHFGHCSHFTLVHVKDGSVEGVSILDNAPHQEGGCMQPVMLLASNGVNDLIVGGMGARPLAGFGQVGIRVFYDVERPLVREAVEAYLAEQLPVMDPGMTCGGH